MSLALDLGLFFRNSKTKLGLSLTHRGLLFTLAIRIGNNSNTWIKQDSLANEANIDERNIRENMEKIKSTGIIIVEKQKHDKRRNMYKFNQLIINYHLLNDEEKHRAHEALGDECIIQKSPKLSTGSKKYQTKSSGNSKNTGQNHPLNTGQNHPVHPGPKNPADLLPRGLHDLSTFPKAKEKSKKGMQSKRELRGSPFLKSFSDDFFPDEKRLKLLGEHAARTNCTTQELLEKFGKVCKKYQTKSKDWQAKFEDFLARELPKRTYEDKTGGKKRYDGQSIHY